MIPTLYYGNRCRPLATVAALDWLLDAIHDACTAERPEIYGLEDLHGCRVDVGLGAPEGLVLIWPGPCPIKPPGNYFMTVNPWPRFDGRKYQDFWYEGAAHTQIETRHLLPISAVRRVVREFFLTGVRADDVDWEEQFH